MEKQVLVWRDERHVSDVDALELLRYSEAQDTSRRTYQMPRAMQNKELRSSNSSLAKLGKSDFPDEHLSTIACQIRSWLGLPEGKKTTGRFILLCNRKMKQMSRRL